MYTVNLIADGRELEIQCTGAVIRFHALWLRDNAWDADTRSPGNGQKLVPLSDIPMDIAINEATVNEHTLHLTFQPENKTVAFDISWLLDNAYDREMLNSRGWMVPEIETWDSGLMSAVPEAQFNDVKNNPDTKKEWLSHIERYGFARLLGGPVEDQAVLKMADLFGYVRETNYGRHFDVRSEINPANLANTGLGLKAHTDNPYRDPVPTIQILYCLECSAAGGENMIVDGFRAVQQLQQENPAWFDVLSNHCARFEFAGHGDVRLCARRPMIELAPDGELIGVRFNSRSAAAITDVPYDKMELYYAAYRRMAEIIDNPDMEVSFRLNPGECFLINNTRVLHARKAYSGTGSRWLQGCYADMDGLRSTLATLREQSREAAE